MFAVEYDNVLFSFLMQPRFRIWRHIFFVLALVLLAVSQSFFVLGSVEGVSVHTIYRFGFSFSLVWIMFVYFNIYWLTPRYLLKHRYTAYLFAFSFGILGIVVVKFFAESQVVGARMVNGVTILDWLSNAVLYGICIVSSSVTVLLRAWVKDNRQIETLENKKLKRNIEEFKSHINPRLLYATLDHAAATAKTEPGLTSGTLFKLSELLRFQLYDSKREKVVLESEVSFLRNYLHLQKKTSQQAFIYTLSTEGNLNRLTPPALFIPVLEMVLEQQPEDIRLHLHVDGDCIRFHCTCQGADLLPCNLLPLEQRMEMLGYNVQIEKTTATITITIC